MLYGGIYSCIENNIRRLSCYLSIIQLGFILIGISIGTKQMALGIALYLAIHILYKSLLGLSFAALYDHSGIERCEQLKRINSQILNLALLISFAIIINFPLTASFMSKLLISAGIKENFIFYVIWGVNILMFIALPLKQLTQSDKPIEISINRLKLSALLTLIIILLGLNIYIIYELFDKPLALSNNLFKQIIITFTGLMLAFSIKLPRTGTEKINFDLLVFVNHYCVHLLNLYKKYKSEPKDRLEFNMIENRMLKTLSTFHDQSIAIGIIFIFLILLILAVVKV